MDGPVDGRLIFGSKKKFSRVRLSGLRGPRTVVENFLARCFSRPVNDITVFSEQMGETRRVEAFGRSVLGRGDEEEKLGVKEWKVIAGGASLWVV